ncbi:MAG: carbon-nitrogen family hydrolase [Acidaminococcaceae bacterium]|nr:carbon-nitrogen family hydrolase [Acidaminococcaceae bacterium]
MKIALVQMEIKEKNKQGNIEHAIEMLEEACPGRDLVVLPEIWTTGYSLGKLEEEAEPGLDSFLMQRLSAIARQNNCNLAAGSVPMKLNGNIYNDAIVFNRAGELVSNYGKMHLFGLYKEERFFAPGTMCRTYKLDDITCGSAICYDMRFPELFRHLALEGAEMVILPAEWPTPRGNIWRVLTQARAMENHMFMCTVNCVGQFKSEVFYGHSMLVAPDGRIIVEGGSDEDIYYGEVDWEEIVQVRKTMNVLQDIRPEFYPHKE